MNTDSRYLSVSKLVAKHLLCVSSRLCGLFAFLPAKDFWLQALCSSRLCGFSVFSKLVAACLCALRVSTVVLMSVLSLSPRASFAQKPDSRPTTAPLDPAQAESEARTLVADMLARKPEQNVTNLGAIRIRDPEGKLRELPVRYEVAATPNGWVSIYETTPADDAGPKEKLKVLHPEGRPTEYYLTKPAQSKDPKQLSSAELMVPFAGSDFWVADLGLEFLHWPKQRLLKKEMKKYCFCLVLESINPKADTNGYVRVVSWIDSESGGVVHADAYDTNNELLKVFDPTQLKKIEGQRQLEEMEMRNKKTGSHSWVKYNLK